MEFRYLGTAAAEGFPALFCDCDSCRRARAAGGRNLRGRSQAIIDDRLLLDFPADTGARMLDGRLNLPAIRHCLITHFHEDHLYPAELGMRGRGFAYPADDTPLVLYGTTRSLEPAANDPHLTAVLENGRVQLREIRPFEPFAVDRYTVTALPANHCPGATFYHISDGRVAVLYAHDTGYFYDEVWDWLAAENRNALCCRWTAPAAPSPKATATGICAWPRSARCATACGISAVSRRTRGSSSIIFPTTASPITTRCWNPPLSVDLKYPTTAVH